MRGEVEELLYELGIKEKTIMTGIRRDVARMISAMDVFLMTSLWEGLPRVIPQAMSMRIPVIANRADGTVEAIDHGITGYLCDPGDIHSTVKYCRKLLLDKHLCQVIGMTGRKKACQMFDLENMIVKIDELYERLLLLKGVES